MIKTKKVVNTLFTIATIIAITILGLIAIPINKSNTQSSVFAYDQPGANLTYQITGTTLTISGTGDMYDFVGGDNDGPWLNNDRNNITTVIIESGVTSIGYRAFQDCEGITSVEIRGNVTTIGESAFWGCINLASLTLPASVTSIGSYCFSKCRPEGFELTFLSPNPCTLGEGVFTPGKSDSGPSKIIVPNGRLSVYQTAFASEMWDNTMLEEAEASNVEQTGIVLDITVISLGTLLLVLTLGVVLSKKKNNIV